MELLVFTINQSRTVSAQIDDTNTRKLKLKNYPLAILYNFVVQQRAIKLQYTRVSLFSSTNIQFVIC